MKFIKISALFLILAFCGTPVLAQTTAFSYQGRLSEASRSVTGNRFFRFTLFDENGAAIPGATVDQILSGGFSDRRLSVNQKQIWLLYK